MAVYCGVCAARICSASENDGSFSVDASFKAGWELSRADHSGNRRAVISNTCEECGPILRHAIAAAANEIAASHAGRIAQLKAEVTLAEDAHRKAEKERSDFENAWRTHRAGGGK